MLVLLSFLVIFSFSVIHAAPVLFIIQTQPGTFHQGLAQTTRSNILKQWSMVAKSMEPPEIILTTELDEQSDFAWTYFPFIPDIAQKLEDDPKLDYVGILRETTDLNLGALGQYVQNSLGKINPKEESLFYGKGLKDEEPTIVHDFHQNTEEETIMYPDPEAGIFLSRHLVLELNKVLPVHKDFSIDPEYQLAEILLKELGVKLTHVANLCSKSPKASESCITQPRIKDYKCLKSKEVKATLDLLASLEVYVSTVQKFHQTRVTKILETYADLLPQAQYISDIEEEISPGIKTKVLPYTVNTENGHCNKTRTMIDSFIESGKPWLLILDDDTVLSPARLAQLLSCYDGTEEPIILGQRYGYSVTEGKGYNYVTGGGGKIINRMAAIELTTLQDGCGCPKADTPEDMHIFGICARKAGIPITHSHRMFQARPPDYPFSMISPRKPISFHKHWEIDPVEVYYQWFKRADDYLRDGKTETPASKDEL